MGNLPGTRDLLPEDTALWQFIETETRGVFERYGFYEIRTPVIEPTELFARGIGGDTDIVGKEMYTFRDQSERSVTLRPEATASVMRAYIQNTMYREGGLRKLYYLGPMFRHEKKQKGRWRQFFQVGAEAIGSDHPAVDAEIIEMSAAMLEALGVKSRLLINSVGCRVCRPKYVELLRSELEKNSGGFCGDCQRRAVTNSLRVLDCKIESCQPLIGGLPVITEHLCEDCAKHFTDLREYLDDAGIVYEIVPRLVRGLDYYTRTAFEIVSGELGSQNALAGGGRYDGLSEVLGGPAAPAIGFAVGLDRLAMILSETRGQTDRRGPELFLAWMGDAAFRKAREIARHLRRAGHYCHIDFSEGSLKSRMRLANKLGAKHVLIIGDNELASERYAVKCLADSEQWEATLPELENYLAGTSKNPKLCVTRPI
jgi:histidyl-tRNA synthetase